MSDDKNVPDVDDLATVDDLERLREEIQTAIEEREVDVEPAAEIDTDEIESFVDREDAAQVADQRVTNHLDHLINEDCDTEACEHNRDGLAELVAERLGLDMDGDAEAPADDPEGGEADAEPPEDSETDGGDTTSGADDADDAQATDDDADADADDDDEEEVETNVFGEPVW